MGDSIFPVLSILAHWGCQKRLQGGAVLLNKNVHARSQKFSTKARALLAGGLVLGIGAAFTLAAWTDNEWVFGQTGGADGPGNPGTNKYQMQQNTYSGAAGAAAWSDQPEASGGGLTFTLGAKDLKPGSTVYAPMQLRAVAGSAALVAALAEAVQAVVPSDPTLNNTALYNALTYQAKTGISQANCTAGVLTGGTQLVPAGSALTTNASGVTISLPAGATAADPGTAVDICFALTLPSSVADVSLQGKNTVPLWRFTSITGS